MVILEAVVWAGMEMYGLFTGDPLLHRFTRKNLVIFFTLSVPNYKYSKNFGESKFFKFD